MLTAHRRIMKVMNEERKPGENEEKKKGKDT